MMESDPKPTGKPFKLGLAFWLVLAFAYILLFNFDYALPRVLGYLGATVGAAAITVAVWIYVLVLLRQNPRS
jgi:uncharacterized MAPEG superfamily protein